MRILVVGAGAIGGYYGGRLMEAGSDVTFLVRPRRAAQLTQTGLQVRSAFGDLDRPAQTVTADKLGEPFDLILLSCKAYDLEDAMASFAPAVGADTAILPLLNGMRHLDVLEARFGAAAVLGGYCVISTTLDAEGRILHLNKDDLIVFGGRDGSRSDRIAAVEAEFARARTTSRASGIILQEMWEKWVFIATAAGITCLMRSAIGDIVAAGAGDFAALLLAECAGIADRQGFAPREAALARALAAVTAAGSGMTASMLRDVERGARTEADHIIGDLLRRGGEPVSPTSLLRVAYAHLGAYEARRARDGLPVRPVQI
ncbi:MAG TPA: 2-dehydropantoate 2-reductase [Stellaceae bacterium]|nr:2-dehydropantoate 2-reductase [Stellaceae bacterium]